MSAPKSSSASTRARRAGMIQLDVPAESDAEAALARARALLRDAGIDIDPNYRPVRIGTRTSNHYVLRGEGTAEAIERARKTLGIEFFPDLEIAPVSMKARAKKK